ncbi:VOC family protein [Lacticaseibacillus brantae]|nr:VOC family protein [Lacticaseibacillus brantae]
MTKLHHVSLLTQSAAETDAFYRNVLGLRRVKNTVNQENVHMRHLFYGDNLGTPGTVVTFFAIDHLGSRYDGANFLTDVHLWIPTGSLTAWHSRISAICPVSATSDSLRFDDPSGVHLVLTEHPETLSPEAVVDNQIPAAEQILGLATTDLVVQNPQASLDFFSTMLNVDVINDSVPLANGKIQVLPSHSDAIHRFGRGSMDHVAVSVTDDEQLLNLATRAKQHGYEVEELADRGWFKSLYVREPNGNRIEFATTTPGFSLDEPLETMGQSLGLPPRFESQRQAILTYFNDKGVDFND